MALEIYRSNIVIHIKKTNKNNFRNDTISFANTIHIKGRILYMGSETNQYGVFVGYMEGEIDQINMLVEWVLNFPPDVHPPNKLRELIKIEEYTKPDFDIKLYP